VCAAAPLALLPLSGLAQPAAAPPRPANAQAADEQLILTVRANGIERGEFTLLRRPDGDYWVGAEDLPRLQLQPSEAARRQLGTETYYSLTALGGSALRFDEADLSLSLVFPAQALQGTQIDLSNRPPPVVVDEPRTSLILSYRLGARNSQGTATQYLGQADANLRIRGVLLRQETRFDTGVASRLVRGRSQAIYDDRREARRYVAGDTLSTAGAYGSAITGAGVQLLKLYDLAPDLITQPTATFRTSSPLPAEVEVAVDGTTISRTRVAPGPITVDNLLLNGGARTVRVTVTDTSGRREVIEQPFLFTDTVLAQGLHDYGYFLGRRSELGSDNGIRYLETAWQGFHRYGATDHLTVSGGGEGNPDFANLGAGITLRSDRLGLLSLDLLASHDRSRDSTARGWSARYTYVAPAGAVVLGRREFEDGFRTFTTSALLPFLRRETRVGLSTRILAANLSADLVRSEDARERRDTGILRLAMQLGRRLSFGTEVQSTRVNGRRDWAVNVFLRAQLDGPYWVSSTAHASQGVRSLDVEAGRQLDQGEGFGWRVGTTATRAEGADSAFGFLSANWNLRRTGLEFFGTQPVSGGGARFSEFAVSGSLVGVDGSFGLTRQVNDSFVLARLGVPVPDVDIFLNNQMQGKTDRNGQLFIPDVGAFGRQDVSLNDKQVPMQFNLAQRRRTVTPAFRSGTVVEFGGTRQRAIAGMAWQLQPGGARLPIASRAWPLSGPAGRLDVETGLAGDFYLENAQPGRYAGKIEIGGRSYDCRLEVPDFAEAVYETKEGLVCE
jgi:outer membrane usher protein